LNGMQSKPGTFVRRGHDYRIDIVTGLIRAFGLRATQQQEAAVEEALTNGPASDDVILNMLARRREPPHPRAIAVPDDLALRHPPQADCVRYDSLRGVNAAA